MTKSINRREILTKSLFFSAAGVASTAALAQSQLCDGVLTRSQPQGPFYPVFKHPDLDADLTIITGEKFRARGEVVDLDVLVTDVDCNPIPNALVDLWQACATGKYDHPSDPNTAALDPYFQYAAKVRTNTQGIARIRTIKPGSYPADASINWVRPPHIHFRVSALGYRPLVTQTYFAGEALNPLDLYIKGMTKAEKKQLIIDFVREDDISVPKGLFKVVLAARS